jgi:hypothetical protein
MADDQKIPERPALYLRLTPSDIPVMVWPHPSGEEAIVQFGRQRPYIVQRYAQKDDASMNVVIIDLLARTKALVSASDWHVAMGTGLWPDGIAVDWSAKWSSHDA